MDISYKNIDEALINEEFPFSPATIISPKGAVFPGN
jgi:hypothetical protein